MLPLAGSLKRTKQAETIQLIDNKMSLLSVSLLTIVHPQGSLKK